MRNPAVMRQKLTNPAGYRVSNPLSRKSKGLREAHTRGLRAMGVSSPRSPLTK